MRQFLERFLGIQAPDPQRISKVADLLSNFVVDFPGEADLERLIREQAIAEADAVRLRFTMSVANQAVAVAAMKEAIAADLSPLMKQRLHERVAELSPRIRIGDYVKNTTELTALGSTLGYPPGALVEKTRIGELMAWQLFELLGKIRGEEYAAALAQDAPAIARKGFPKFSRKVAVHYAGESLADAHAAVFVDDLAARLNEIYRSGYAALVKEAKNAFEK